MKTPAPSSDSKGLPQGEAAADFIEKLKHALQRDGDFPANAKTVGELRMLVSDPKTTANQVTEVILREPSLGTRVLHVVNSSFYRRAKPIMTVSQAVVQLGMRPLAELCAGLILLQKFIPAARRGGPFATCLQRTIITSLLASTISSNLEHQGSKGDETGYLAGSFLELGVLLLGYYFPQVYETALKRSESKRQELQQSIKDLTGLSPIQISLEVLNALNLPDFYKQSLAATQAIADGSPESAGDQPLAKLGSALFASQKISSALVHGKSKQELDAALASVKQKVDIDAAALTTLVGDLPRIFKSHCSAIDLVCPALPEFVSSYAAPAEGTADQNAPDAAEDNPFTSFVEEIREAVESREPTASIITRVMETLAWSLGFDRVFLMLVNPGRKNLSGRMLLGGLENFDPKGVERSVGPDAGPYAPDAMAFRESRPVFNGDPILPNGWPIVAIPIGYGTRSIGVIYADKTNSQEDELAGREQAAIGVLAELLDRSVTLHAK